MKVLAFVSKMAQRCLVRAMLLGVAVMLIASTASASPLSDLLINDYGYSASDFTKDGALVTSSEKSLAETSSGQQIEVMGVSPRLRDASDSDIYDVTASGLRSIGVGQKFFFGVPDEAASAAGGYTWVLTAQPGGSTAALSATNESVVTLVPDVEGAYTVEITAFDAGAVVLFTSTETVYAGTWSGAGSLDGSDPIAPNCTTGFCHGESTANEALNVAHEWLQSGHSMTLQENLNGHGSSHFNQSCLPCHSLGFDQTASAVNNGFDDIANSIGFSLDTFDDLVHDAVENGVENFSQLPVELQRMSSVQCEACHGVGSQHLPRLSQDDHGIDGVNLGTKQCAQCHDSVSGFQQQFYQWNDSSHPVTAESAEGHVAEVASCVRCHTGEGFVSVTIDGEAAAPVEDAHGITCATCHDPHFTENEYQLRLVGDFTFDSGETFEEAGLGGLCMNCHNSRVSDADSTSLNSSRGAHHGPQGDMLLGVNGVSMGFNFESNSFHTGNIENTCVGCHMAQTTQAGPGVTEPPTVGEHSFSMRDTMGTEDPGDDELNVVNACNTCHGDLTDYDRVAWGDYDGDGITEGTQTEVQGLFDLLAPGLLALPGGSMAEEGKIEFGSSDFNNLTQGQRRALYNYNFCWEDGSFGIHNTSYAVQLLQRAYGALYGTPIDDVYPGITLRGPVEAGTEIPEDTGDALASIEVLSASPREVAASDSDEFDRVANGLPVIAIGKKMYLEAEPVDGAVINSYQWEITPDRTAGVTAPILKVDGDGSGVVTFEPDLPGKYYVILTPLDGDDSPTTPAVRVLYAGEYIGAGLMTDPETDAFAPNCATGFCHGGDNYDDRLNVAPEWIQSHHSQSLQLAFNGEKGNHFSQSCMPCHSLGFDLDAPVSNGGFSDLANLLGYDLDLIATLTADAANNGNENYPLLPTELQEMASVQCEACHGAGSNHLINISSDDHGIAGVNIGIEQCAQCHDSVSGFQQQFYQWTSSSHPVTADSSEGRVASIGSCVKCHTGEGFIAVAVNGEPGAPVEDAHGITCAACHDPHYSENEHQLRLADTFTFDSGEALEDLGTGGICLNCHNSRVSDAESTALTSSRGAHHGPQGDMWAGVNGVGFGVAFESNSYHSSVFESGPAIENACVRCHMADPTESGPGVTEPPTVGEHSFALRDTMGTEDPSDDILNVANACGECHSDLMDFDKLAYGDYDGDGNVEGTQTEVQGLFDLLSPGLLALTGAALSDEGKIEFGSSDFSNLTDGQKRALYNYNFCWEDGSFGVHNTAYAVQLLQRAYEGVYGKPITDDYPDIFLRGPLTDVPAAPTGDEEPLAHIDVFGVSPRHIADSDADIYDRSATGLASVGVGSKVYMQAEPAHGVDNIASYSWELIPPQSSSTTSLSYETDASGAVMMTPDREGKFYVVLKAYDAGAQLLSTTVKIIYSGTWIGAGATNEPPSTPTLPECATGACHGGGNANERLNVAVGWGDSAHANKLQKHLNGELGAYYGEYCNDCHTVGYDTDAAAENGGFDDIASDIGYDLAEIGALVADAVANDNDNYQLLPTELQNLASIQCENCHGAGSRHLINMGDEGHGIDGVNIDTDQCARCHDSASGYQDGFYQWSSSSHPVTADISEGHVAEVASCVKCHTGEGFISVYVNGEDAAPVEDAHGITCAACHDPHHASDEEHQLRLTGEFTFDSGETVSTEMIGLGGTCVRCHNSRASGPDDRSLGSSRGAHHGPQGDMWMGINGAGFGLAFESNSFHSTGFLDYPGVPDACVFCHMAESPESDSDGPVLVGEHSFSMRDTMGTATESDDLINAENACAVCHDGLKTYDRLAWGDYDGNGLRNGIQTEVKGLLALLRPGILANFPGTSLNDDNTISISSSTWRNLSDNQKRALYNYNFVLEDGSFGIHNTAYALQLLQRSYTYVYKRSIITDYPNITLRGAVPAYDSGIEEEWKMYE